MPLQIVNKYPASEQKFISDYCYAGIFAENLLDGYGFVTDDQWKTVEFVQEVGIWRDRRRVGA